MLRVSFQQIIGKVALTIASGIVYVVNSILVVLLLECATQNALSLTLAAWIPNPVFSFGAGNKVRYLY